MRPHAIIVAHEWRRPLRQVSVIDLEVRYLPLYAFFSFSRNVMT